MARQRRKGPTINSSLFLSVDLHARLKDEAERQHRSMHAQIIWMLEQGLPQKPQVVDMLTSVQRRA